MISQGDIYWINLGPASGSAPAYRHPHVIVQNNVFNCSRINTVVTCALTSQLKRADAPGNVLINKGEANLPKTSVINVSQLITVDKTDLAEKIGTLSKTRLQEVLDGLFLLLMPKDID